MSAPRRQLEVLHLGGSHRAIGRAHGEHCRASIAELYAARVENAIAQAETFGSRSVGEADVLEVARRCAVITRAYHPAGFEELEGIARGANLEVAKILAMNGLTDIRDVLAWGGDFESFSGCTAFVAQSDHTAEGELVLGQTWDLSTDNMRHVLAVHRAPEQGPETWSLTTAGCLSLIGINEHGVAVGTTNISTTDARAGVTYLSIIHKILEARDLAGARAAVTEAQRAGAHFYSIADAKGQAVALEASPRLVDATEIERGAYVHTNHCRAESLGAIEGDVPVESSHARFERMTELLRSGSPGSLRAMSGYLADTENGHNAICRYDYDGISSNGAVVMAPSSGRIVACHGPPDAEAIWVDLRTGARAWEPGLDEDSTQE